MTHRPNPPIHVEDAFVDRIGQAVLAAACIVLSAPVQAQSLAQAPAEGFSSRVGLNLVSMPTYEGSPNTRTLLVPDLLLSYRSRAWGSLELGQRGLTWNAIESGDFRFSLVAQFDPGRRDTDSSALDPTPGDRRLAGMGRVRPGLELGLGIGYGPVTLVAREAQGEHGSRRAQADLTAAIPWAVTHRLNLRLAAGATWANSDSMQAYFGVTPAQAQATTFSVYTPGAGLRKVELSVGAEYAIAPTWTLQGSLAISRLGDVAAKSPLVGRQGPAGASDSDRRFGGFVAVGMAHAF